MDSEELESVLSLEFFLLVSKFFLFAFLLNALILS